MPNNEQGVVITNREVFDKVGSLEQAMTKLVGTLDGHVTITKDYQERFGKQMANHGDRIRDLEAANNRRVAQDETLSKLDTDVQDLRDAVNRSAWLPVVVTGVLVSVIAAIVITTIR